MDRTSVPLGAQHGDHSAAPRMMRIRNPRRRPKTPGSMTLAPSGVGKSWLACALGHRACRDNLSVLYQRIPRLFSDLVLARGDGRYARLMRALGGVKLLILDDWGLEPLTTEQRHDMLEIVEDRYGRGATLITSQIPVDRWHDLIGDPTLADAILDRVVHNAHRIQLRGDSLRRKRAQENAMT